MILISWVITGTRYFILIQGIVRLLIENTCLVTLEKISFVTPKYKFLCNTSRDQKRKLRVGISRISTDHDSNTIGRHRNALLPDYISNKVYKPDLDTEYKPYLDINNCTKYLFNDPFNINTNPSSYNLSCK